jgi:hypothetical protein
VGDKVEIDYRAVRLQENKEHRRNPHKEARQKTLDELALMRSISPAMILKRPELWLQDQKSRDDQEIFYDSVS